MIYRVYFEIYGKKMRKDVVAGSSHEAEKSIKNAILFHKSEAVYTDQTFDYLFNLFGFKR